MSMAVEHFSSVQHLPIADLNFGSSGSFQTLNICSKTHKSHLYTIYFPIISIVSPDFHIFCLVFLFLVAFRCAWLIWILLDTVFVFRFIAQAVPAERVAPFFPLLSAHLSCAMTHIDTGIQEDAMKILDVLLEHYPALLAARPEVLLTNFLELISHRQNSGGNKKVGDPKGRTWTLSVNPSRAVTSQQWRLSVLLRYGSSI